MRAVNFPGMRNINRSVVLDLIRRHGPISRGEIARRSQLAPSAVTNIVNELIALGLVREGSFAESSGGRPAALLELVPDAFQVVGVNVGFTNIVAVLSDLRGQPLARATLPTYPDQSPEEVLQRVARAIVMAIANFAYPTPAALSASTAANRTGTTPAPTAATASAPPGRGGASPRLRLAGIGVGIPGLVDTEQGYSVFSPNLRWRNVAVRSILEQALQTAIQEYKQEGQRQGQEQGQGQGQPQEQGQAQGKTQKHGQRQGQRQGPGRGQNQTPSLPLPPFPLPSPSTSTTMSGPPLWVRTCSERERAPAISWPFLWVLPSARA